jgi:hypothetical protein
MPDSCKKHTGNSIRLQHAKMTPATCFQLSPQKKKADKSVRFFAVTRKKEGVYSPNMPATFAAVRKIALSLDNVEEAPSYGTPGFRTNGVLFLRFHQDGESLVVRTDFDQREELLAADPASYFITDHYLNYEWILVRPSRVQNDALRDLIRMAHKLAAAEKRKTPRSPRRKRTAR